jgi:hypothetical protein
MATLEKGYSLLYHWYVVSQMSYLFEVMQIGVTEEYDVYVWDYPDIGRDAMINNNMEPAIVIVTDLAGEAVTGMI